MVERKGMGKVLVDEIQGRMSVLSRIITEKEEALKNAPEGKLKIQRRQGGVSYYKMTSENKYERYLANSEENGGIIRGLAQKSYDKKVLAAARSEWKVLNHANEFYSRKHTIERCFNIISPVRRKLVQPVIMTDEQYIEWWKKKYPPRMTGMAQTVYKTRKGDCVRSRAEILIADRLFGRGIVHQYETPLILEGIEFHPDFCVLNLRQRRTFFWEHLGMLDDPDYLEGAVHKLNVYARNGIIIGKNLIITYETSTQPFNTAQIDQMIETFCL